MRRTRYAGLNDNARNLVAVAAKVETVGSLSAVFQSLKRYTMPDGTIYTEFQQAVVQSITEVYFVALKDKLGNNVEASLWTDAEMRTW
jgi:hypothetical protein